MNPGDREAFLSIIRGREFWLSYAKERIDSAAVIDTAFAAPMVSFCDIRLSEICSHMKKYGEYGIGMKKEWAISSRVSPVMYLSKDCPGFSEYSDALSRLMSTLLKSPEPSQNYMESGVYYNLLGLLRYMKNYEGTLARGEGSPEHYRFADEREWRYIPPLSSIGFFDRPPAALSIRAFTKKKKEEFNAALRKKMTLKFTMNDIRYIVVKESRDRLDLLDMLNTRCNLFNVLRRKTGAHLEIPILTADEVRKDL